MSIDPELVRSSVSVAGAAATRWRHRERFEPAGAEVRDFCNVLRDDGVSTIEYTEQLTFLLFLKMAARPSTAHSVAQSVLGSNQPWPGNHPSTRPIGYIPQIQRWVASNGNSGEAVGRRFWSALSQ